MNFRELYRVVPARLLGDRDFLNSWVGNMFKVSPVPGSYHSRFCWAACESEPLYIKYLVTSTVNSDVTRLFSVRKLSTKVYSLVDLGDYHKCNKRYTSWERAYNGMLCICRRSFSKVF